jgi:hypothetical protein
VVWVTPGGLLLRDAPDMMSEDLDWRGGDPALLAHPDVRAFTPADVLGEAP